MSGPDGGERARLAAAGGLHGHAGHDHGAHDHAGAEGRVAGPDALIAAEGICLTREGRLTLDHVDVDIADGEIVTLIGPNGAGKTSLVRVLLGLEPAGSGVIRRREGLVVGYVPQRFDRDAAIPMTVERFIRLGAQVSGEAVGQALEEVGAASLARRQLVALSGGELQRVVLARALVRNPNLLVLDEPARGVDHLGEADLYALIGRLRDERGLGVLLVSHDLHVVMAQSDRVLCINRHICCHGVPETVAQHPEYVRLFGDAARAFAVYHHDHDHEHDLAGRPVVATDEMRSTVGDGGDA